VTRNSNRVAVVTGAAAGIGAAVAIRLAAAGLSLALLDIDATGLVDIAAEGRRAGASSVLTVKCDTRDSADVALAFTTIREELGGIDILANIVGGSASYEPIELMTDERWRATLGLNLDGLFFCTRAAVLDMKTRGWGRIVNTSSLAGRTRSLFGGVDYCTSKGGVIAFTRQLAYDLAPHGISVNAVAPGVTATDRVNAKWAALEDDRRRTIAGLIPAGRLAEPDEPAAAIAFLCGEDAGYISGAVIDVNGGMFIG
jgi:NAD(P)-dependent dehydrogenase (short-subunit alcohol dehydrogenase family)